MHIDSLKLTVMFCMIIHILLPISIHLFLVLPDEFIDFFELLEVFVYYDHLFIAVFIQRFLVL